MDKHVFTLVLSGVPELTPDLADQLYEATDGNIELNMRDGIAYVELVREAPSLQEAVDSALARVEGAGFAVLPTAEVVVAA